MVYSPNDFGSSPASVTQPINLKDNSNETETIKETEQSVNNIKDMIALNITEIDEKIEDNKNGNGNSEHFSADTTCAELDILVRSIENKEKTSIIVSTLCNSDPDVQIFSLQAKGKGFDLTPEDFPRQKGCNICKMLDDCQDGIKDVFRQAIIDSDWCNVLPKNKWKEKVIEAGLNTDIYTYDYVCTKEFDPCYIPLPDGSDTNLDSAPISTTENTITKKEIADEEKEKEEEEISDNIVNIIAFLFILLSIVAYVIYNNVLKK